MFSRPLAFLLLALGCVTAAAGGAYVATRQNAAVPPPATVEAVAVTPGAAPSGVPAQPVAETEAAVSSPAPAERPAAEAEPPAPVAPPVKRREISEPKRPSAATRSARNSAPVQQTVSQTSGTTVPVQAPAQPASVAVPPATVAEPPRPVEPQPVAPPVPQFEEVIVPAASVIGLQVESTLSTERARLEDRVEARVTRDVLAAGRVAIPAGSRMIGSVTLVERGGKVKERARLGLRFHTLVLGDGSEVALQTEPIYRDGESPAGDSAKKIGVAAAGGAILGAILGGKKGAAIGGATGAGAGTAAVMTGDRQAASLRSGEIITARLSSPATITVERRE